MIKTILSGIAIGAVNIIPGVSGGTIMVMLGILDKTTNAITHIFNKENIKYLILLFVGLAIGLIGFANIMEELIEHYPNQTIFWFIGLITLSVPYLKRQKMTNDKISKLPLILGIIIILLIGFLNTKASLSVVNALPAISILFLLEMIFLGFITGAATIFPGISGSMLLLVLGYYGLYNAYLTHLVEGIKTFNLNILLPIAFIGIGVILGIYLSSKLTSYLLKNYQNKTMSLILGLIVGSIVILIPTNIEYNFISILSYIGSFLFGAAIVYIMEKYTKKNNN